VLGTAGRAEKAALLPGMARKAAVSPGMAGKAALLLGTERKAALLPGMARKAALSPGTARKEALTPGTAGKAALLPPAVGLKLHKVQTTGESTLLATRRGHFGVLYKQNSKHALSGSVSSSAETQIGDS